MGRVKLEIKKIDTLQGRHSTFSKRKTGLMKKTYELSTLCDTDVAVIMFSPSRNCLFFPPDRIESIIDRFLKLPDDEKAKRRLDSHEMIVKIINSYTTRTPIVLGSSEASIPSTNLPDPTDYDELMSLRHHNRMLQEELNILYGHFETVNSFDQMQQICEILGRSYKLACQYMAQRFQRGSYPDVMQLPIESQISFEQKSPQIPLSRGDYQQIDNMLQTYESNFKFNGRNGSFIEDDKTSPVPIQHDYNPVFPSSEIIPHGYPYKEVGMEVREINMQGVMQGCKEENFTKDVIPFQHVHTQSWNYLESLNGASASQPPYCSIINEQVEEYNLNNQMSYDGNMNGPLDLSLLQPQQGHLVPHEEQGSCSSEDSLLL